MTNDAVANVLRALRDEPRLVALVGAWSAGEAIISWNPAREATGEFLTYDIADTTEFKGGWIGSWGYDGSHVVGYYDFALILRDGQWSFVSNAEGDRIDAVRDAMSKATTITQATALTYTMTPFELLPSVDEHAQIVQRTREYIKAGDIFQANMCLRFEADFFGDPVDLFCEGLKTEPAYGALIKNHDKAIVSLSPELFLSRTGRNVITSPIKGTVSLNDGAEDLHESPKNRAENTMIVDLMRNDLSRVCLPHSVEVPHHLRVERHSVWHLVSDVVGELQPELNDHDLLTATFPPGSVTGAPKIRAMEIIDELESSPRHAYTGAIGYAAAEALELNVAIRTFEIDQTKIWLGVGGGIVIDSDPLDEVRECFIKAEPLIKTIGGVMPAAPPLSKPPAPAMDFLRIEHKADRSLGIYESALIIDGEVTHAEQHRERLLTACADLGLDPRDIWDQAVAAAKNQWGFHRLRIDVSHEASFDITNVVLDDEPWELTPRIVSGGWGEHKWRDRTAIADADYLFIDDNGDVLETSRSAVGVVFDDGVHLPLSDQRILPSIERQMVIDRLRTQDINIVERAIKFDELTDANEIFVMNSIRGTKPVIRIEGIGEWKVGPLTNWLRDEPTESPRAVTTRAPHAKVLVLDNHDSFVFNLARYVRELSGESTVVRSDAITVAEIDRLITHGEVTHIIISPGPKTPRDAGISVEVVKKFASRVPILGVCLGHQCIAEAFGGRVVQSERPTHGKASVMWHDGQGTYWGITGPFMAGRYHSLVVTDLPEELMVSARTGDGTIMGIRHRDFTVEGVQMHPESLLTPLGHSLIANFLQSKAR